MSDLNIPDLQVRQTSVKANIVINTKFFGSQNINFQEILSNLGNSSSNQVTQNISQQGTNISLDFLYLGTPDTDNTKNEQNPSLEKNFSPAVKVHSELDNSSIIYSRFNPQKTAGIDEKTFSFSSLPEQDIHTRTQQLKENFSERFNEAPEAKKTYTNAHRDTFTSEEKPAEPENTFSVPDELNPEQPLTEHLPTDLYEEHKEKQDGRHKKKQNHDENRQKNQDEIEAEAEKIIEVYGLTGPRPPKAHPNSNKFTVWLSRAVLEAGKRALTVEDSEKLAKYVVSNYHYLPFDDRQLLYRTFSGLFQHKLAAIRESYLARTDRQSLEIFLRVFPHEFAYGFIKKIAGENGGKKRRKIIARITDKVIRAIPLSDHEAGIFLSLSGLDEDKNGTFKDIFKGRFEKLSPEKIFITLSSLAEKDFRIPGFVGCIHEIYLDCFRENKMQIVKQLLRLLESYFDRKDLSGAEINLISTLIAGRYFNNKNINQHKTAEIFSSLISGQRTEYYNLDLICQLSGKNPLAYLPVTIDKDVKDYLKAMPVTADEIIPAEEPVLSSPMVKVFGKVKVLQEGQPMNLMKPMFSLQEISKGEIYSIKINADYFIVELPAGDYLFNDLTVNEKKLSIKHLESEYPYLGFNTGNAACYYYGTLNIFFGKKERINKLTYKNEPNRLKKSFLEKYGII